MITISTIFNKIDCDWVNIKNKCRTTVNKDYTSNVPSKEFKTQLIVSEHSPIRLINIDWSWKGIKSWVATHWCRHKWECFISTQRSDRTGVNRDDVGQGQPVNFDGNANGQHVIDTWRKRLCKLASPETRVLAEDYKIKLYKHEPELSEGLVPNCVYRCGCPEFNSCGFWEEMLKNNPHIRLSNIKSRYNAYNDYFYCKKGVDLK